MHMIKKRMLIFVQRRRKIVKAARLTKQHKVNNGGMLYGFILLIRVSIYVPSIALYFRNILKINISRGYESVYV